jgi:hypothetical protein
MTTPPENALDDQDAANAADLQETVKPRSSVPQGDPGGTTARPSDPEQAAMLDVVLRLSTQGPTTAGAVADTMCFPLPEVRRILEQLSPDWVRLGDDGEDGTPQVSTTGDVVGEGS